jgi:hypothetical protein
LQLGGLFETLIGDPVTTGGNHRCMLLAGGKGAQGYGSIPFDHAVLASAIQRGLIVERFGDYLWL